MNETELGKEQIKVMRVLWAKGRCTAHEVTEELNRTEPYKHISVQMLLRKLVKKGIVSYDVEDRTYIYYPLLQEDRVIKDAFRRFVDQVFAGRRENLVSYIIKNGHVSPETLRELSERIDEKKD